MKLHFEPNLDYQLQAIESVCDLFRGQEICRTEFTVTMTSQCPASQRPDALEHAHLRGFYGRDGDRHR